MGAYNKDGIPMLIIRNELPRINGEISKILHGVVGFTVTLETDKSGSDLEIFIDYGDSQRPIELGSGMEKMLASLAIRVALINISSLPKSDILIIDEALAVGDRQFRMKAEEKIRQMRQDAGTVFLVSHNMKSIQDTCNRVIWLEKGELLMDGEPKAVCEAFVAAMDKGDSE
jgi:ABC-type glutathione transport system ATPase component